MLKIYKASAGSGKTFTLAREYIRLLIGKTDPETGRETLRAPADYGFGKPKAQGRILAVTFTRKATEEMSLRIVKELYLLARQAEPEPPESKHAQFFTEHFGCTSAQLARTARLALEDLLFNFAYFNVSTIDSFFQNIVRVFARDLDLPDNYSLEIDQSYLVAMAVNSVLNSINRPVPPGDKEAQANRRFLQDSIIRFMRDCMERGLNSQLLSQSSSANHEMLETINSLMDEDYKAKRQKMEEYCTSPQKIQNFAKGLPASVDRIHRRMQDAARALLNCDPQKIVDNTTIKLAEKIVASPVPVEITEAMMRRATGETSAYTAAYRKAPEKIPPHIEHDLEVFLELLPLSDIIEQYRHISRNLYYMVFFGFTLRELEEYCAENDAFLLGNTNMLIRDLIDQADAPFIYERTGTRIDHYLIDEFQDTSRMQWLNFSPLVTEGLSHGHDNLIIGDEKQAIYRFRNSDPNILGHEVLDEMGAQRGFPVELRGESLAQNTNYRSAREIVLFNNSLFRLMADSINRLSPQGHNAVLRAYRGLVQQVAPGNLSDPGLPGYVKLILHEGDAPDDDADDSEGSDSGVTPAQRRTLQELSAEIERQLAAGYRPGDIAVLVRTHADGKRVIDYLLARMDQPDWPFGLLEIMSTDALAIGANRSVRRIVNLLQLLSTPEFVADPAALRDEAGDAPMRENPVFARRRLVHTFQMCLTMTRDVTLPDGTVEKRRLTPGEALEKAVTVNSLSESDELRRMVERHLAALDDQECPTLYEIAEAVAKVVADDQLADADNAFITAFLDLVADFADTGDPDLESFLRWWDRKGSGKYLTSPEGLDAITVTTIHQAKGLEFPCVHVPFFSARFIKANDRRMRWYPLSAADFPDIDPADVPPMIPMRKSSRLEKMPIFSRRYLDYCEEQRLDALNVAYVALTRAVRELTVYSDCNQSFTKDGAPSKDSENLGWELLQAVKNGDSRWYDALASSDDDLRRWMVPLAPLLRCVEGEDDEPADTMPSGTDPDAGTEAAQDSPKTYLLEFGTPTVPIRDDGNKKTDDNSCEETRYLKHFLSYDHPKLRVVDDAHETFSPALSDDRERGTFLHSVLSRVRTLSDLPRAMRQAAYRAHLSPEDEAALLEPLAKALEDPRVRPWFDGFVRVASERPATTRSDVRRPDRIVWMPDGSVHVIDYKFGETKNSYIRQVRNYMWLMRKSGYRDVKGFIFYPFTSAIVPVPLFPPK